MDITEECGRVLAPHGTLVVELGDTYSGSGGAGGDYAEGGMREGQERFDGSARRGAARGTRGGVGVSLAKPGTNQRQQSGEGWPLAKSLCLIPELYRVALVYGFNPLTGRRTDRWRARNVVRWCRPNPPVGALGDKFRPATSEMVVACKSGRRWFDLDAVRTALPEGVEPAPSQRGATEFERTPGKERKGTVGMDRHPAGAPPLDWWEIPTSPYKGQHYATFPERLCVRPIKAMCPLHVCTVCGEPRRRITETVNAAPGQAPRHLEGQRRANADDTNAWRDATGATSSDVRTVGWTVCECPHPIYRPGRVLDIFGGSGTTLAVAVGHGRDGIGIDLDVRNADLARERIGPMFFKETTAEEAASLLA